MTEKDLDIAIEKCERIMEFDTRTMQNPVSENGWIFEKVYELLQYLRQLQFATDTNVGGTSDTIRRTAVLDAVDGVDWYHQNKNGEMVHGANSDEHQAWYKADDIYKAIESVPSAQQWIPTSVKPPEPFKLVLIQDSCGDYDLTMYIPLRINPKQYPNGYWGGVDTVYYDYFDVEAWCPLPAPYIPEGEEHERSD